MTSLVDISVARYRLDRFPSSCSRLLPSGARRVGRRFPKVQRSEHVGCDFADYQLRLCKRLASAVANLFFLAVGVYTVITVKRAYMKQLAKRQAAKLRRRNSELDLPVGA